MFQENAFGFGCPLTFLTHGYCFCKIHIASSALDINLSQLVFPYLQAITSVGESKQKQPADHCTHSLSGGEVARQYELLGEQLFLPCSFPSPSLSDWLPPTSLLSLPFLYLHTNR